MKVLQLAKETSFFLPYVDHVAKGQWAAQVPLRKGVLILPTLRISGCCSKTQANRAFISCPFSEGCLNLWLVTVEVPNPTTSPQLGQLRRVIPAPCGIAGGLHWNCIMVQLLPPSNPASLPITDFSELTPQFASSTQTSLFPRNLTYNKSQITCTISFSKKWWSEDLLLGVPAYAVWSLSCCYQQ